jgi:hypothetical protein
MTCRTAESADGGAAGVCFQGSSFHDYYNAIAPVFCGGTANQAADVSRFLGSWRTTTGTTTLSACSDGVTRPPNTMVSLPVIVTQGTTSDLVVDDTYGCATKATVTGNTATILAGQTCTETATGATLTYTTSQCTFFVHADGTQADATLLGTVTAPASSLTCMFRYDLPLTKQ